MQRAVLVALVLFTGGFLRATEWALTGALAGHDPSIIREGNTWWCFTTGAGLKVKSSTDGLNWKQEAPLFTAELSWWRKFAPEMRPLDVWAPDIQKFGDRFWCYYSVSEFGRNNSAIGLKSCTSLAAADWRDDGFVLESKAGVQTYNAIDPNLTTDASGQPWLVFGSWFAGIQLVRLDPHTMKPVGEIRGIARRENGIEGANVVHARGFFFLFVSIDKCCVGVKSTYKIACGRAKEITGPYLARDGSALLDGGGTVIEAGAERWKGPGGQDVYDNAGAWVIARHAYDADNNGKPALRICDLCWDDENWPSLSPTTAVVPAVHAAP